MDKAIVKLLALLVLLYSCSKKHYICPAYNSYFIHDEGHRDELFSPFHTDTTSDAYYGNEAADEDARTMEVETTRVTADAFWGGGGLKKSASQNDKNTENNKDKETDEPAKNEDSGTITLNYDHPGSKYHPKENAPAKKKVPTGLLTAIAGKNKMRNVSDIEMKVIIVKPLAKYSNVDSSSINKKGENEEGEEPPAQEAKGDTL